MSFANGPVLFHRSLESEHAGYDLQFHEGWHLTLSMWGRGSAQHTKQLIAHLDELDARFQEAPEIDAAIDLSGAEHAPIRVQMMLGKWLFSKRHRVRRMAVFGGPPLPMKIARAVCTIARMDQVSFFDERGSALHFLTSSS